MEILCLLLISMDLFKYAHSIAIHFHVSFQILSSDTTTLNSKMSKTRREEMQLLLFLSFHRGHVNSAANYQNKLLTVFLSLDMFYP